MIYSRLQKHLIASMLSMTMAFPYFSVLSFIPTQASAATLNLKNANIRSLISTVAQATKKNFIIDPRVNGNVTVLISEDLSPDALYQVFLSILSVHGFVAVDGEHVTKILPASQSKSASNYPSSKYPEELTTTVIPIQYINAQQIIPVLRPFVPPTSFLSVYAPTNVLIVHDTLANLHRLRKLIKKIDKPLSVNFEIIQLNHASASEMAKIIQNFVAKAKTDPNSKEVKVAADSRTNRLIINADDEQRLKIRALVADLDIAEAQGNTHVVYLRYADAKLILPILQGVSGTQSQSAGAKGAPAGSTAINLQADDATNSIIITASQDNVNQVNALKSVIRRLDIRRAQVLIEAIIAEVSTDVSEELGVQLVSNTDSAVGIINFNNQIPSLAAAVSAGTAPSIPLGSSVLVGQVTDRNSLQGFGGILNYLSSNGNANILSTPVLVTLDNQEASILVGQEVPFISNTQLSASNTNPFQNFERRDVGITLKVKPQINEGDTIQLEIEQEISSVVPSARTVDTVTSKRTIKTTVLVEDGRTLVLGGLIDEQENETRQKVPFLGDIPLIGFLFRFDSESTAKRNLMIFIKPSILRNALDVDQATFGKYNLIRSQQLRMRDEGSLKSSGRPLLNPLNEEETTEKGPIAPNKPTLTSAKDKFFDKHKDTFPSLPSNHNRR